MSSTFRGVVCLVALAIIIVSNVSANPYTEEIETSLQQAVNSKMGAPYRWGGTDDRGYDCSGFVWRALNDAGIQIERSSARDLYAALPEASAQERGQFGTLVFFNGLSHVGIVRDEHTFYHSSSSQGVVLARFADYWGSRIVGFRRASAPRRAAGIQRLSEQRIPDNRFNDFSQVSAPAEQRITDSRFNDFSQATETREGRKGKKGIVE